MNSFDTTFKELLKEYGNGNIHETPDSKIYRVFLKKDITASGFSSGYQAILTALDYLKTNIDHLTPEDFGTLSMDDR